MSDILMSSPRLQGDFLRVFGDNRVTLVISGTGTGKTVTVPMLIHRALGSQVVCTEPRIINTTGAVAGTKAVHRFNNVGYKTALESLNPNAGVLFATDGLVANNFKMVGDVLIIDEVHEFNSNMELLLNYARIELLRNSSFRLVLMSATVDSKVERIRSYFEQDGISVGQCNFEGRGFPIEFIAEPADDIHTSALKHLQAGRDTMVFVAGKNEAGDFLGKMAKKFPTELSRFELLTLSSESDEETRRKITTQGAKPRLWVATNVAQAGITPANLGAVLMTGLKKIIECRNGYEGLETVSISLEDATQQMGRCGRLFPGIAEWHGAVPYSELKAETPAEILRIDLAGFVLSLLCRGINPLEARFVNQPSRENIETALTQLRGLGAVKDMTVTPLGKEMNSISLAPRQAKAVIVARKYDVVASMVKTMSCVENNMLFRRSYSVPQVHEKSAAISLMFAYDDIKSMTAADKKAYVNFKAQQRIAELNKLVFRSLGRVSDDKGSTEDLRRAIAESAGVELFKHSGSGRYGWNYYTNVFTGIEVQSQYRADYVTGSVRGNNGRLYLDSVTEIETAWIEEIYADSIETVVADYTTMNNGVVSVCHTKKLGNVVLRYDYVAVEASEKTTRSVMGDIDGAYAFKSAVSALNELSVRSNYVYADKVDATEALYNLVVSKFGFINSYNGVSISSADYNVYAEFSDFMSADEYKSAIAEQYPTSLHGCDVEYTAEQITVRIEEEKALTMSDADFSAINAEGRSLRFRLSYYNYYETLASYQAANAEKLAEAARKEQERIMQAELQEQESKASNADYSNAVEVPAIETVAGEHATYFHVPVVGGYWSDAITVKVVTDETEATELYAQHLEGVAAIVAKTVERKKEESEREKRNALNYLIRNCDTYKSMPALEAMDVVVEEVTEDGHLFYATYFVSVSRGHSYDETTDEYIETFDAAYSKKHFMTREEAEAVCEHSNKTTDLLRKGWKYTSYDEYNGHRRYGWSRLIVGKRIIKAGENTDNVFFIKAEDGGYTEVLMTEGAYATFAVKEFGEEPNDDDEFDDSCDMLSGYLYDMREAFETLKFKGNRLYFNGAMTSLYDRANNECYRNSYNNAKALYDELYDTLVEFASKRNINFSYVNPFLQEEDDNDDEVDFSALLSKWGS